MNRPSNEFEKTEKLIRLKGYESPPEGYYEGFLNDFHQRQRAELMKSSAHGLFFERLGTYLSDFGRQRWLAAGGAACAVVFVLFSVFRPEASKPGGATALAPEFDAPQGQVTPVSTSTLDDPQIDLLEGFVAPLEEEMRPPLFLMQPDGVRSETGQPQIIEL